MNDLLKKEFKLVNTNYHTLKKQMAAFRDREYDRLK